MSRSRERRARVLVLLACACALAVATAQAARYDLGRKASDADIAALDIDVRPDGAGLPPGRGSVAEGQALYDARCAQCHGTFGESNAYAALAGGIGTLGSDAPVRTTGSKLNYATTLFDYIRRAMPFDAPKSLADDQVYALTAYVLHLNELLPADATLDRASLVALRLPNRDGFTGRHGFARVRGRPDVDASACMRDCASQVAIVSEVAADAAAAIYGDVATQSRHWLASAGAEARAPADLARDAGCMTCHGVAEAIVGPAFVAVARRYHADAAAEERLLEKVAVGSSGAWGTIAMPGQPHVTAAQARRIVRWILGGATL